MYPDVKVKSCKFKLSLNDTVRITLLRNPFSKGYDQRWSEEYFLISDRFKKQGLCLYKVKDILNQPIEGTFYEDELQQIKVGADTIYVIERVIRYKGRGLQKKALVRWRGWGSQHDSWIASEEIVNYG